jgi:hypothetical protein
MLEEPPGRAQSATMLLGLGRYFAACADFAVCKVLDVTERSFGTHLAVLRAGAVLMLAKVTGNAG